jgi:hypothetical protein
MVKQRRKSETCPRGVRNKSHADACSDTPADTGADIAENEKLTDRFVKSAAVPDDGRPYRIYYDHEVRASG